MYIRITSKCNMKCDHCCFSCEPGKGEHMSLATFRQALQVATEYSEYMTIGGGEPTLHPHFETMLLEAIANSYERMFIVTNGTHKRRALMLAKLARAKVIDAELSTDYHHNLDLIDPEVMEAFRGRYRDVSGHEVSAGRWSEYTGEPQENCVCETILIEPNGDIKQCGCPNAPVIGTVENADNLQPLCECVNTSYTY